MKRLAPSTLALGLLAVGCGAQTQSAPLVEPTPSPERPAPSTPTANPSAPVEHLESSPPCVVGAPSVRLRIDAGQALPTGTGLTITNAGASHDNFGPAGFDVNVNLRFQRGDEVVELMPSFRDHRATKVLGHCYRLVDGAAGTVVIEVSVRDEGQQEPSPPAELVGAGGPSPGAASCSVTDDNGPLPGGKSVTTGCAPHEICLCEVRAGHSCRGRCAPTQKR